MSCQKVTWRQLEIINRESQIYEYIDRHKFFDNSKETSVYFLIQGKLISLKYEYIRYINIKFIYIWDLLYRVWPGLEKLFVLILNQISNFWITEDLFLCKSEVCSKIFMEGEYKEGEYKEGE